MRFRTAVTLALFGALIGGAPGAVAAPHRFCHDHHDLCRLFGSHARQGDRNEPVELPNPAQKCFWPRQESAVASW